MIALLHRFGRLQLKGKINAFPVLKCAAYVAILIVLLLGGSRARFYVA